MHACNPALQRLNQEDYDFEASLGYIATLASEREIERVTEGDG
jgi:hypothetical protein